MKGQSSARFNQFLPLQGRQMRIRLRVIAFLVGSPGDLMNLVAISSVFSYPIVHGKPAYLSTILSMQSEREVRGRDGITVSNCVPYADYGSDR